MYIKIDMDKNHKKEVLASLEEMMRLSLYYCRDDDDEIKALAVRINNLAHDLSVKVERHL